MNIRPMVAGDIAQVAHLVHDIRTDIVPAVHSEEEIAGWIAAVLLPRGSSYVIQENETILAWLDIHDGWVDQLYCLRGFTGKGIGLTLLNFAKSKYPNGLLLYTFQANQRARRFYRREGFIEIQLSDGKDNEEKSPDALLEWKPAKASDLF